MLEFFSVGISLLFILSEFVLIKKIWGTTSAWLGSLFLVFPNFYLLGWSHEARLHYPFTLFLGNMLFLLALKTGPDQSRGRSLLIYSLMGCLAGIGWWVNHLFICYLLAAILFIAFHDRKFYFSLRGFLFLLMFAVGSLPLWTFNLQEKRGLLPVTTLSWEGLAAKVQVLIQNAFPILLGFDPLHFRTDPWELTGTLFLGACLLGGLIISTRAPQPSSSRRRENGRFLFLLLFLVTVGLSLATGYGLINMGSDDPRYLLPLYLLFPGVYRCIIGDPLVPLAKIRFPGPSGLPLFSYLRERSASRFWRL